MISVLSRREFVIMALYLGAVSTLEVGGFQTPRVRKLSGWRSHKGLDDFKHAFEFLESLGNRDKAPGRYPIDGDRMYSIIAENNTIPPEAAQFEAHRRYIDIHYLIRGAEMIGLAVANKLEEAKPYDVENDLALYKRPQVYKRLILMPGDFVVFYPGQAHMPSCNPHNKSEEIKKVVVKVLAEQSKR
jgi:biofilm protein TabA